MSAIVGFHDHAANDIGGHQIGGELDSRIAKAESARESAQQGGLAKTGHALQQHVTAGQQADEHAVDNALLPDDDLCDLVANLI
jgi:branched-subunit amino acid aminotransferase/4-amino-4-deoxychorismate lyase